MSLILLVGLIAAVTGKANDPAATKESGFDLSSCQVVANGFAQDFFAAPKDKQWASRVGKWVDPQLSDAVSDIDPSRVPSGTPNQVNHHDEAASCDVVFDVKPANVRVRVEASTPAGDGLWYVTAWREMKRGIAAASEALSGPTEFSPFSIATFAALRTLW
ncbi:hypothetical protein [Dermatophilus congolensis]|uniref:hypothetical protein n=1 Tax=Dermatophilus congolensis TaxID=1863 RepID=UPI001AAF2696|nr:hypothetical protein [Dermatophilus congolensis]MBO3131577.1 hypothetical protein [Dermatophilus congolensis]MBO3136503.1 hypothetical protein [Dermatophilus congolensis]MBO3138748.1 hypothetical protein [Dermatophilus congolensis]MBO3140984.1 hypothetical protein [Dermatophilus congolensis]MBO3144978.1 hypothetical protein [Dermatophilus congolensis]